MNVNKLIGVLILVAAGGLIYQSQFAGKVAPSGPSQALTKWQEDLTEVKNKGLLPKQWKKIQRIEYYALTDKTRNLIKNEKPKIHKNPLGLIKLEVTLDDWSDGKDDYLLVVYNLVDMKTDNTFWEISRNIMIGKAN